MTKDANDGYSSLKDVPLLSVAEARQRQDTLIREAKSLGIMDILSHLGVGIVEADIPESRYPDSPLRMKLVSYPQTDRDSFLVDYIDINYAEGGRISVEGETLEEEFVIVYDEIIKEGDIKQLENFRTILTQALQDQSKCDWVSILPKMETYYPEWYD